MFHWWQKGVVYQIYPRSFMDSNNDGIGDLQGVIDKLDYLEWLGIDAIWFSPLFPSPMKDFGYDVSDYVDIHPEYGTLDNFDRFLADAHERDIKIILDLVPNHTSDEHGWFLESRSSRDNPKRDWYIWKDPAPDGGPPNNWLSYFGGVAWTFDDVTGQYYLHNFVPGQPDLNWRNPEVKAAMFDVIRFWLSCGVDGFRIDVIDRIIKDELFRDNPVDPDADPNSPHRFKRVYSEQRPEVHEYIREMRAVFDEFPETVSIGEIAYSLPLDKMMAFYGKETQSGNGDELHLPFNFHLIGKYAPKVIRDYVEGYDAAIPLYGWPNYVLGNHDVSRLASDVGQAQARVMAMLLLTLRGTPTIYYGEELGMTNVTIPEERILDPQGKNKAGFNRDECRTPMQWDGSPNAGFSADGVETWLPVAADYQVKNVKVQQADDNSTLNFYRRLLNFRRETPALCYGRYYAVEGDPDGTYIYVRQYNDQQVLIALNFTDKPITINLPDYGECTVVLSTNVKREGEVVVLADFVLQANEGLIFQKGMNDESST